MIVQNNLNAEISTVVPNSFDSNGQEERIRAALKIAWGPLPDVQLKWLRRYCEYLNERLSFPFHAEYAEDIAGYRQVISPVPAIGR
ncbi:MAG: hypothetical protein ABFC77_09500 [Thermoguttaceae bacterium]